VSIVLKSGSLNFLEHSGPVQVCNGVAFIVINKSKEHLCHDTDSDIERNSATLFNINLTLTGLEQKTGACDEGL